MSGRDRARQRANAQLAAAEQTRRAKAAKPEFDWDAAVTRLRAMLNEVQR